MKVSRVVIDLRRGDPIYHLGDDDLEHLIATFPGVRFDVPAIRDELTRMLPDADVFVGWSLGPRVFPLATGLRWIQFATDGMERRLHPALRDSGVRITSARGIRSPYVAQHVLALILSRARAIPETLDRHRERRWAKTELDRRLDALPPLEGETLLVIGLGEIGARVARMARALGLGVVGCRRSPAPVEGVDEVVGPDGLDDPLARAGIVVLAAPLTGETRGILDADRIARLRPDVHVINVGRGELVDEDALRAHVSAHEAAAASLDVFADEPLDPDDPWWTTPGALVSPHVSAGGPGVMAALSRLFARNLARFVAHEPLENEVDPRRGY